MQLDQEDRGFSFSKEGPLDMRMDRSESLSAKEVVNSYSEKQLGEIFREYGEERQWKKAAQAIIQARKKKSIETTTQLSEILSSALYKSRKKLHPATLAFQALRIFVNRELESIQIGVKKALGRLAPGGVIGAISFHSLEDRLVKNIFREASKPIKRIIGNREAEFLPMLKLITKTPLTPTLKEQKENPRSTSAKLRFAEKL